MIESRSLKVLILSSGQALTALVGIVSAAVLARVFSPADYASYRQTILAYTFAVPFVTLGFDRALYYFLPGEQKRTRGALVENLLWLLGGGALLSLFLALGGNDLLAVRFNNPALAALLLLLIPYPMFMLPATSLSACLMARNRTEQVAGFNVGSRLLMLLAIVVPCLIWPTPRTAVLGTVLGAAVTATIALTLMFRSCDTGSWRPTAAGFRKQISFSVPLGLATLVGTVAKSLDQVMVASLCAPAAFAVYVNGAMQVPLIGMLTSSTASVLMVDYARFYKEGRTAEVLALIHRAMVKVALLAFPIMVFFMCMAPEVMSLVFGAHYRDSSIPFRLYLLMLPVRILSFSAVLQATGHSRKMLAYSLISLASNSVLLWVAIRMLGPLLAPIGPVISLYAIGLPYLTWTLRSILRCSAIELFPWGDLAQVLGVSCLALPALAAIKFFGANWPGVVGLGVAGLIYGTLTLGGLFAFGWGDIVPWRSWLKNIAGHRRNDLATPMPKDPAGPTSAP